MASAIPLAARGVSKSFFGNPVLKEVSTEHLRSALKTATPELRSHVLGAMSRRASQSGQPPRRPQRG